jgi:hypothetical protein
VAASAAAAASAATSVPLRRPLTTTLPRAAGRSGWGSPASFIWTRVTATSAYTSTCAHGLTARPSRRSSRLRPRGSSPPASSACRARRCSSRPNSTSSTPPTRGCTTRLAAAGAVAVVTAAVAAVAAVAAAAVAAKAQGAPPTRSQRRHRQIPEPCLRSTALAAAVGGRWCAWSGWWTSASGGSTWRRHPRKSAPRTSSSSTPSADAACVAMPPRPMPRPTMWCPTRCPLLRQMAPASGRTRASACSISAVLAAAVAAAAALPPPRSYGDGRSPTWTSPPCHPPPPPRRSQHLLS